MSYKEYKYVDTVNFSGLVIRLKEADDEPETAVCPQCGDTAYMGDDGVYVCVECGNEFGEDD